ncbi:type III secretion system chaperone [unidentified bacterial endosymbiont]|uniref:type III secretion system chaperone n=1 Tax=unidentified bacterial endosymbiont TaxID=2355 RepID=UPI0020A17C5A|nr:type III secretion system chaperone [unidentified bacterial endosymbiont]
MTFSELLQSLNADAHFNINDALQSGGCTMRFDDNIDITFENHDSYVYLFSPVMQITQPLSDDFFASLLQIHLFGIATHRCWFGYDAGGQRIILFCLMDLALLSTEAALKGVETLVDQAQYWKENLPKIGQAAQPPLLDTSASQHLKKTLKP